MPDTDIAKESFLPAAALEFQIPFTALPVRLDKVLARLMPDHSRSRLQGWIEGGHVLINGQPRSEEHTSELQSLMRISYAVFCLKKKKKTAHSHDIYDIKKRHKK